MRKRNLPRLDAKAVDKSPDQLTQFALLHNGMRFSVHTGGRSVSGTVQSVVGANILVKMAHGFVARIPAEKLRITRAKTMMSKVV